MESSLNLDASFLLDINYAVVGAIEELLNESIIYVELWWCDFNKFQYNIGKYLGKSLWRVFANIGMLFTKGRYRLAHSFLVFTTNK